MHNIKKAENSSWVLWIIVTIFYSFQYVIRVLPINIVEDMFLMFSINAEDLGIFNAAYYIGYSGIHIPMGIWYDRYGPQKVLSISALLSVIGLLPLIFCDHWYLVIIGRFIIGAASAGAALGLISVLNSYFPDTLFSRLISISVTIGLLGGTYGGKPVGTFIKSTGLQNFIYILFVIGVAISILLYLLSPKYKSKTQDVSVLNGVRDVLLNYRVILVGICGGLMVGPLEGFADSWGIQFFINVYNFEWDIASSLPSTIFFGMCVGLIILPTIIEKFHIHIKSVIASGIIISLCFLLIIFIRVDVFYLRILLFIAGIFCSYQTFLIYINSFNAKEEYKNLTMSVTNMTIMAFGSIYHYAMAFILKVCWDGYKVNNIPKYTKEGYIYSASIIPLGLIIAVIFISFLRKTKRPIT